MFDRLRRRNKNTVVEPLQKGKPIPVLSINFPMSILGYGLSIPKALVVHSNEHLVVRVDQPNNSIRQIIVKTPKSSQYKAGDIVKLFGVVERQSPSVVIKATTVNFIGRMEDYEVR